jgi:hypothetical protein
VVRLQAGLLEAGEQRRRREQAQLVRLDSVLDPTRPTDQYSKRKRESPPSTLQWLMRATLSETSCLASAA